MNDSKTGRFVKGNRGGPGNPVVAKATAYRLSAMIAITPEEIQKLLRVLFKRAMGGDVQAARIVLDRVLGRADVGESPNEADENFNADERFL